VLSEIEKAKRESDEVLDGLKSSMEATDLLLAEVKRDAFEFRRDVIVGAENAMCEKRCFIFIF
jgi:hypothetical protein